MIILAITDIHGHISEVDSISKEIAAADIVILTGDLTHFGGEQDIKAVIDPIRQLNPHILAIPGNCDHHEVDAYLAQEGMSIQRRSAVIDGIGFVGVGGSLPCPLATPIELSEDDFEAHLQEAASGLPVGMPMILVVHQPPYHTINDFANIRMHVGSRAIRRFVVEHNPIACFTGHIHEGIGIDTVGQTKVINPGPLWQGHYTYAKISDHIEELEIRDF